MSDHTYVVNEIVGTSTMDVNDAIRNGVKRASRTLRNLDWFEVVEVGGISKTMRLRITRSR